MIEEIKSINLSTEEGKKRYKKLFKEMISGYNQVIIAPYYTSSFKVCRARISYENRFDNISELNYPPIEHLRSGRFNLENHQVYYCADNIKTALIEVEPKLGDRISVSVGYINKPELNCIRLGKEFLTDLQLKGLRTKSKLILEYLSDVASARVGEEEYLYLPTQLFHHSVASNEFDAIVFKSVAASFNGVNFVIKKEIIDEFLVVEKINDYEIVKYNSPEDFYIRCVTRSFMIDKEGFAPREIIENCPTHHILTLSDQQHT